MTNTAASHAGSVGSCRSSIVFVIFIVPFIFILLTASKNEGGGG